MTEVVVLSPHLDDAALSAGGLVAAYGARALVVTCCTADAPARLSPFAASLHALQGGALVAERRDEDRAAMARLGCAHEWLGLADAIYRCPEAYVDRQTLFGPPVDGDPLGAEVAAAIARLPPEALLLAPLAVGGHVDHRVVSTAARRSGRARLAFYEDFPYVAQQPAALAEVTGGLTPSLVDVTATTEAWRDAVAAYASQHAMLAGGAAEMLAMLRAHLAHGVRIWR